MVPRGRLFGQSDLLTEPSVDCLSIFKNAWLMPGNSFWRRRAISLS